MKYEETLSKTKLNVEVRDVVGTEECDIVAVHREGGDCTAYKLNDGRVISEEEAVAMCKAGQLPGFIVGESKFGEEYIRGIGDGKGSNNLQNKPYF